MSGVYLAAPGGIVPPPPGQLADLECNDFYWTGYDGVVWDIGDPQSGIVLGAGVRGLTMPDIDWYTSDSPAVDGVTDKGYRVQPREVFWPLRVYKQPASQAWNDYDTAFWRTLYPGRYGTWKVTQPGGTSRLLRLRLVDDGQQAFDTDPALSGWARYGIRLLAPDPYWADEMPVTRPFAASGASQDFFGGGAPDFHISSGETISSAAMPNPGDVPAWPVWTIVGPTTSVDVGLNGHVIQAHFTVAAGKAVIIDTDPRRQTAVRADVVVTDGKTSYVPDGTKLTGSLGSTDFAPIPPGESVSLSLSMTGTGSVIASITPRYYRAW